MSIPGLLWSVNRRILEPPPARAEKTRAQTSVREKKQFYFTAIVTVLRDCVPPTAMLTATDGPGETLEGIRTLIWLTPATRPVRRPDIARQPAGRQS